MRKHAFVTGIDGFTGQYLQQELNRRGWEVSGLVRPDSPVHVDSSAKIYRADLSDERELAKILTDCNPGAVINLAAIANVAHGNVSEMYRTNLLGTRALLAATSKLQTSIDIVLLASSANVYGNSDVEVISELTPANPANDYGVSKLAMELMARTWMNAMPITIVRPFNYTGVGQSTSFVIPKLVDHYKRKLSRIELGNIDVFRDYSDVRDIVCVYCDLLEHRQPGRLFNVASGQARSLREIATALSELSGFTPELVTNPAFVRQNEIKTLRGDASALRAVSRSFHNRSFRETLQWMLDS